MPLIFISEIASVSRQESTFNKVVPSSNLIYSDAEPKHWLKEGVVSTPTSEPSNLMATSQSVQHTFQWDGGGREVFLVGSFNNWEKIPVTTPSR